MQHLVELASVVVIAGTGAGEDLPRGSASPPGTGRHAAGAVIEHSPGRPLALVCFSSWIDQALHLVQMATGKGGVYTPCCFGRRHRPRVEQHTRGEVVFRVVASSMPAV